MTQNFEIKITINTNTENTMKFLDAIKPYVEGGRDTVYNWVEINGSRLKYEGLTLDYVDKLCSSGEIEITGLGPSGRFTEVNESGIFRDMAEAAPEGSFVGEITGSSDYDDQELRCELVDGILSITTYYESLEDTLNGFIEYFTKVVEYEKFMDTFKLDKQAIPKKVYKYFLENGIFGYEYCACSSINDLDYDDFMYYLSEEYDTETGLDEDELESAKKAIASLAPASLGRYPGRDECGSRRELKYNPLKKEYIGKARPLFNDIIEMEKANVNDILVKGLKKMGVEDAESKLGDLSVDDAYDALFAGMDEDWE